MKNTDVYKTRDLYLASLIFCKNFELLSVELDGSNSFFWFTFLNKDGCEKAEQAFFKNEVSVKAKDFSEAIKFLKRKVSVGG